MRFIIFILIFLTACTQPNIQCGDLLEKYGERPENLDFISCKAGTGQVILEANYRVDGKHAQDVENFFIEEYEMDSLHFVCCGFESVNGQNGSIYNEELQKINPYYVIDISMYGNSEKELENDSITLEYDRTKIDFDVTVRLLEV